jgi:hypothetical protein
MQNHCNKEALNPITKELTLIHQNVAIQVFDVGLAAKCHRKIEFFVDIFERLDHTLLPCGSQTMDERASNHCAFDA